MGKSEKMFTLKRLEEITGIPKITLFRRATRENWRKTEVKGIGGVHYEYAEPAFPNDIRAIVLKHQAAQAAASIAPESPEMAGYRAARNYLEDLEREKEEKRLIKERGLVEFARLPEARKREAEACWEVLKAKDAFIEAGGFGRIQGAALFCAQFNAGKIPLDDGIVEIVNKTGKLHPSTLYRWEEKYETQGLAGLAWHYGKNAGRTLLTPDMQDFIRAMILEHNRVSVPKLMAGLEARFAGQEIPASHVVWRWASRWRDENRVLLLSIHNPDEWKSRYGAAFGSASASVGRLNQLWESDATPGDIMLAEGRHTVIGMIDVWSRRAKVLVVPSSKAVAIAALLRRCLLDWGVPEVLRTDNGKDFTARHMTRVLESLEIEQDLCPPFTPEMKPHIERFFHTFSHGIVELLPGYIGHNVAQRKAIESRKSFAERLMKKGTVLDVKLAARKFQEICDRWIESVYHQDPHGSLDGKRPAEMVRSWTAPVRRIADERALDVLLAPAPQDGGVRKVGKKGVTVNRRHYVNTALIGYEDQSVQVLLDYADVGKAYIFADSGEYVCTAVDPDWSGISAADLASHAKHTQKKAYAEMRKEARKLIREHKIALVPEDILAHRESLLANVEELPKKTVEYSTPALKEAAFAVADADRTPNAQALAGRIELPPEVLEYEERQKKVVDLQQKRRERRVFANNEEIYCWILDRIKAGSVTETQKQWKKEYEAWQETEAGKARRKPFTSTIGIRALTGETAEAAL
jgi:transposase InsO family protein